jgi:hypothetical protein
MAGRKSDIPGSSAGYERTTAESIGSAAYKQRNRQALHAGLFTYRM